MKPAPVTDFLLHDLVMSAAAEGAVRTAVAAAVTLDERILLSGQDSGNFQREWGLPGGMPLPGETLTDALSRILACGYGLDVTESGTYLGSHDSIHGGEVIRTFVFTATCADPAQICQHARIAHCWADPAAPPPSRGARSRPPGRHGRAHSHSPLRQPARPMPGHRRAPRLVQRNLLRRSRHRTAHQAPDLASQGRLHHAVHHHPGWPDREHHRSRQLGRGDHRPAGRNPSLLRERGLHSPPGRQPRQGATPVDLRDLITGLDRANIQLVLNAIRHAGGRN